jgi:hypothetical protein
MRLPSYSEPETLDMTPEEQLEAIRELFHPTLTDEDMARVRRHPAVRAAIKEEDYLILAWSDGSVSLHWSVDEAIRSIRPEPSIHKRGA